MTNYPVYIHRPKNREGETRKVEPLRKPWRAQLKSKPGAPTLYGKLFQEWHSIGSFETESEAVVCLENKLKEPTYNAMHFESRVWNSAKR